MAGSAVRISLKTSPQQVTWATVRDTWQLAGTMDVFGGIWMNDHLTDMSAVGGASLEALTLAATLVHLVPGKWVGHAVLSNTFRHPVLVAKAATVLDHATGGRYILGLGAGWHAGEHEAFGLDLAPIGPRIDRLESAVGVIEALFSPAAAGSPGVTRPDPFYPLQGATNRPPPLTAGGPPIYLGGQRRRGIALAARAAAGWLQPGTDAGDVAYFTAHRARLLAAITAIGRNPDGFAFAAQVGTGRTTADHRRALVQARGMAEAGATEIILGLPADLGPDGLVTLEQQVARPLREHLG